MSRLLQWIVPIVLFAPSPGSAQVPGALAEGQRVRVAVRCEVVLDQLKDCRKYRARAFATGTLRTLDADTLWVGSDSGGAELAIPLVHVTQVWVVDGKRAHVRDGALLGAVAGAVVFGVVGAPGPEDCVGSCGDLDGVGAVLYMATGALLGGVVGARIKSDRWQEVPVGRPRVSLTPQPGGIGASVSIAF